MEDILKKAYKIFIAILVIALTATWALGCSKNTYLYTKENEYKEKIRVIKKVFLTIKI